MIKMPDGDVVERAEAAMAQLLLSATSVDMEVRCEADDAVKNLITALQYEKDKVDRS